MVGYRITKQYTRGGEQAMRECFQNIGDARTFIEAKMAEEAALNVKVIYRIYAGVDLVNQYDTSDVVALPPKKANSESGAAEKGSGSRFQPTPFNLSPRPPGAPHGWIKDEDEDELKKK